MEHESRSLYPRANFTQNLWFSWGHPPKLVVARRLHGEVRAPKSIPIELGGLSSTGHSVGFMLKKPSGKRKGHFHQSNCSFFVVPSHPVP